MALRIRKKLFHHIFCGHPVCIIFEFQEMFVKKLLNRYKNKTYFPKKKDFKKLCFNSDEKLFLRDK